MDGRGKDLVAQGSGEIGCELSQIRTYVMMSGIGHITVD